MPLSQTGTVPRLASSWGSFLSSPVSWFPFRTRVRPRSLPAARTPPLPPLSVSPPSAPPLQPSGHAHPTTSPAPPALRPRPPRHKPRPSPPRLPVPRAPPRAAEASRSGHVNAACLRTHERSAAPPRARGGWTPDLGEPLPAHAGRAAGPPGALQLPASPPLGDSAAVTFLCPRTLQGLFHSAWAPRRSGGRGALRAVSRGHRRAFLACPLRSRSRGGDRDRDRRP